MKHFQGWGRVRLTIRDDGKPLRILPDTKRRLDAYGIKNETYDALLNRLFDELDRRRVEASP